MKKIIPFLMVPFMVLTLGACNGGDKGNDSSIPSKTVTITDKDGKEQQIVLKKGKGDQEMATALMYVVHGDYSTVKSVALETSNSLNVHANKNAYVDATIGGKIEIAPEEEYLKGSAHFTCDMKTDKTAMNGNVNSEIFFNPKNDENVYINVSGKANDQELTKKGFKLRSVTMAVPPSE